ncbi:NAD-dependent succinate-semialdehyde dehydrogenase [Granulosicoccus antarcticus]|uniref:Alpha-ketoglutaric semialdehyde dehydrogenase n=1 Tax=Granulosicoccus antarcticus IMCC3135 TaxID=1192854 RepID=A0A2Z2NPM2_9GAMM|nr:NAD-dependent succinate-semialdehyde dehydrogenase [Granulosicoccus antarcticus]ASJ73219.1 Alpha-ketoglutaric semialdehyde dehydrogenase [Granulosicoccus antarcticus IMCC3135]
MIDTINSIECQFIDGKFQDGSGEQKIDVIDPATGLAFASFNEAGAEDLDHALTSSFDAFKAWRIVSARKRQDILLRAGDLILERAEEIAVDLTRESGKPLAESRVEVATSVEILRFYAEEAKRIYGRTVPSATPGLAQRVVQEPVGPVIAFVAWNFPAVNFMRKVAAAIAAGCSIIIKPSEETPVTGARIAGAFRDAGLPDGVLNVVYGSPDVISRHLCASSIPRKLTFTGSVAVGRQLIKLASENLLRTTMELGGHAPFIVFKDADIDLAAKLLIAGKFRNGGQVCVAPSRFLVHSSIHNTFVGKVIEQAGSVRVGPGSDETTTMGPLANARRVEQCTLLVDDALSKGAKVAWAGTIPESDGYYFAPTILEDVPENAQILIDEPFGPIAPIVSFTTADEAFEIANRLPYGLAAYAFTSDQKLIRRIGEEMQAGMTAINTLQVAAPEMPFVGLGWSGWGSDGGPEGLAAFLTTRIVNEAIV